MTVSIPQELLDSVAKEAAKKVQWISVPGLSLNEDSNSHPDVYLEFIKENNTRVGLQLADVFNYYGNDKFTVIMLNKIKPQYNFLAMSVDDFEKEMFS